MSELESSRGNIRIQHLTAGNGKGTLFQSSVVGGSHGQSICPGGTPGKVILDMLMDTFWLYSI